MADWRPIKEFPSYEVSDEGQVRRATVVRGKTGAILKPGSHLGGYLLVQLYREGHRYSRTVHSLVARAFIGPRPDGHEVNHRDLNPRNNHAVNLEYTTSSGNKQHAIANGGGAVGERHGLAKLTTGQVAEIRRLVHEGKPQREIASMFGISQPHVSDLSAGRRWRHQSDTLATQPTKAGAA